MKISWFHLMPYTDLPADFTRQHESVWVDIDPALFASERIHQLYNDYMDEMEFAAQLGFDGVCVNEHHANGYGLMPSPNLVAATMARRTHDAALVIMGNSLALYNPPTRVAEELAMLDCISGGRLVAGFPVGSPMDACYAYGQNPSSLRDRYLEAHDLILRAWRADAAFMWNGRFHKQRYVNCIPKPLQTPHPPIWIPGGGSIETWNWCAEMDYVYCYLSYFGYKVAERTLRGYWKAVEELGKDRNPYRAGFLQFVGVAETRERAMEIYREPAEYFYGRCLHVHPRWANPPGYMTEATVRARAGSMVAEAAKRAERTLFGGKPMTFEEIVDKGYVLVGSPEEVAEQLREVAKTLHVGQMMLLFQYGNMQKELANYNTELFAKQVAPEVADLFDDRWENRWWPRPLPSERRAAVAGLTP